MEATRRNEIRNTDAMSSTADIRADRHGLPDGAALELAKAALTLARRFHRGGTLWCVGSANPQHAQHVAVEFVHPVVVGARALPASAVLGSDVVEVLRSVARPDDALLIVGADLHDQNRVVREVLRYAGPWGLATILIGAGQGPAPGAADHAVWVSDDPVAQHDGRLVLGYHLLWELTHICFEHPGLLVEPEESSPCVTCSDEGRLAEVLYQRNDEASVRTSNGTETVNTVLVGPLRVGDIVVVHAGTAISVVDP